MVADIKEMFSQVLVEKEEDRDALGFLWFAESDLEKLVKKCRMRSHAFGAKSSPCCAAFALKRVTEDNCSKCWYCSTTIRVPNLLRRSFLVPSSLTISCVVCVVQATSLLQFSCSAMTVS